jgi:hypothetical protein
MITLKVRVIFDEEVLGSASGNPDIHGDYIASKAPDAMTKEEEIAAIGAGEVFEKGMTVFPRDPDGNPIVWDYQWKGYFKDCFGALKRIPGTKCGEIKAYKKEIDTLIFPQPRMIPIKVNGEMGLCQRPLRGQTAQGERVALATSESIPAGSSMEFEIVMLLDSHEKAVLEALNYGQLRGFGQWRNSGKGRFHYEIISKKKS